MSYSGRRSFLSGAEKRKRKKGIEEMTKKLPKLHSYFSVRSSDHQSATTSGITSQGTVQESFTDNENELESSVHVPSKMECSSKNSPNENIKFEIAVAAVSSNLSDPENFTFDLSLNNPTDISDANLKKNIISYGPCKPKGPFPRNEKNRCFSDDYYYKKTLGGQKISRLWLCYSQKLDVSYCEPCWLFADRGSSYYNPAWVRGVNDWQGLSKKVKEHEASYSHLQACVVYAVWQKDSSVDTLLDTDLRKEINFWKEILKRIVDVTLTLASSNLAFRGHREQLGEPQSGNFLAVIELLAKYDATLSKLFDESGSNKKKITYMSPRIQNELINMLASKIKNEIISEIKDSFYSIIFDTTQDVSKQDQLSQIFRYVSVKRDANGSPIELSINESFLGFTAVSDGSAEGLVTEIIDSIESRGISINKCRGQGYDGAAVMSGVYSGVQERIRKIEKNATYIHCAAHNLNLVLNDAAKIPEVSLFYVHIQRLYVFFSQSIKRWELLQKSERSDQKTPTLKRLCPTRWSSRRDALFAVRFRYMDIMKALSYLVIASKRPEERNEASVLKKYMETYEFILHSVIQSKILETTNLVSKVLQSPKEDLFKATKLLGDVTERLQNYRTEFSEIKQAAEAIANIWGTECQFTKKRKIRTKKFFDELSEDQRLDDPEQSFKVNVFYANIDIIVAQIKSRFISMKHIVNKFEFLHPSNLIENSDDQLYISAKFLAEHYSDDLSSEFPQQLLLVRNILQSDILKIKDGSIKDLAELLIIKNHIILPSVPDVSTALKIFLTLPVTVASAERSFSKLKLIKSYLRSSMAQERLSALSVISIEVDRARKLDIGSLVEDFAEQNIKRKKRFLP